MRLKDVSKLVGIADSKKKGAVKEPQVPNTFKKRGDRERSELGTFFKDADKTKVSDSNQKLALGQVTRDQRKVIKSLRKRLSDSEIETDQYEKLSEEFRVGKESAEAKIVELSNLLEEAKNLTLPLKLEYNAKEEKITLGSEVRVDKSFVDFTALLETLAIVFPDLIVKVVADEPYEDRASKVRDSILKIQDSWKKEEWLEFVKALNEALSKGDEDALYEAEKIAEGKAKKETIKLLEKIREVKDPTRLTREFVDLSGEIQENNEKYNTQVVYIPESGKVLVQQTVDALEDYIDGDDEALQSVEVDLLPEELKSLVKELRNNDYLPRETYDALKEGLKRVLEDYGVEFPDMALLADSRILTREEFLKDSLGVTVMGKVPGTPARFRVSDSENKRGFAHPTVIKEGGKFIIFE